VVYFLPLSLAFSVYPAQLLSFGETVIYFGSIILVLGFVAFSFKLCLEESWLIRVSGLA
jgi:hypothetical protein